MRTWIFPNNPDVYEPQPDFEQYGKIDWTQNRKVETGDIVYIYRSSPIKKILWKCEIGKVNYYVRDDDEETYSYTETDEYCYGPCCEMIPLIAFPETEQLSFASLKANGLKSCLMGPQTIQQDLIRYLESVENHLEDAELYKKYVDGMPKDKLREQALKQQKKPVKVIHTKTKQFIRNACVSQYAKVRAQGICQLCGKPAPFKDEKGNPYLESHHIIWLSRGGQDTIDNVVALCPNCHKKMHVLDLAEDVQKLQNTIKKNEE